MRRSVAVLAVAALVHVSPAVGWTWPVDGPVVRPFVYGSDPYAAGQHRGVDVGAPQGTVVRAATAGTVSFAGTVPSSGKTVTVRTASGYSVTYLELGSIAIGRGAEVAEGEPVGAIGSAAHVHFGVRLTADPQGYLDPLQFLPARVAAPARADPVDAPPPVAIGPKPVVVEPGPLEPVPAEPPKRPKPVPEPVVATPAPKLPVTPRASPAPADPAETKPAPRKEPAPPAATSTAASVGGGAAAASARVVTEAPPAAMTSESGRPAAAPAPTAVGDQGESAASSKTVARSGALPRLTPRAIPAGSGVDVVLRRGAAFVREPPRAVPSRPLEAPARRLPADPASALESRRDPAVVRDEPISERDPESPSAAPYALAGFLVVLGLLGVGATARRRQDRGPSAKSPPVVVSARCRLGRMRPSRLVHACARAQDLGWSMPRGRPRRVPVPYRPLPRPRRKVLVDTRG